MSVKPTHDYLDLTRKYRRGTFVLLTIVLLICAIPFVYPLVIKKENRYKGMDSAMARLQARQPVNNKNYDHDYNEERRPYAQPPYQRSYYTKETKGSLFYFDPNTINADGWKKLGLRDKTIATIMNYRNKGGKFKIPGDIKKIWGLPVHDAERLMPYINIVPGDKEVFTKNYSNNFPERKQPNNTKTYAPVNINLSDTSAWIALPGIGSKLSQRIVNFREKLGGFYSVEQVGETFGLPDSVFQKIKPWLQVSGDIKKININSATIEELKAHPYIRYQLGNTIIQYRAQHGNYKQITDLKKIMSIDEAMYKKLFPYLSVD